MNKTKKIELDPKCFKKELALAITNRGELIPCCYIDSPHVLNDPEVKKLVKVSVISKENPIKKILTSDEWIHFETNLKNDIGPIVCQYVCKKNKETNSKQTYQLIDPENEEILMREDR